MPGWLPSAPQGKHVEADWVQQECLTDLNKQHQHQHHVTNLKGPALMVHRPKQPSPGSPPAQLLPRHTAPPTSTHARMCIALRPQHTKLTDSIRQTYKIHQQVMRPIHSAHTTNQETTHSAHPNPSYHTAWGDNTQHGEVVL